MNLASVTFLSTLYSKSQDSAPKLWNSLQGQGGMDWEFGVNVVVQLLSPVRLFATPWTVAHQAPPSMGFPRQEYWSGLPFLSPGDIPKPGIKPTSPAWQVDSLPLSHLGSPIGVNRCKLLHVEMDGQQGSTIQHRKLYSISLDKT